MVSENLGEFRTVLTTWPCIACSSCTSVGSLNIWVARSIYVVECGRDQPFFRSSRDIRTTHRRFPSTDRGALREQYGDIYSGCSEDESDYVIVAQPARVRTHAYAILVTLSADPLLFIHFTR